MYIQYCILNNTVFIDEGRAYLRNLYSFFICNIFLETISFIDQGCDTEKMLRYSFLEIENSVERNLIPANLIGAIHNSLNHSTKPY
jgi:hypothetical protein